MADSDLDAELLALAGDSSDEEPSHAQKPKSASPPPRPSSSSPQRSPEPAPAMARKGTAKSSKRSIKARRDDAEEGELSSAESHNSLQSASMSESDSEGEASPPPETDEGPIFPYEKLYYSAKDKEEIMAMPEIQREELLSERAQQVDRHNQDLALRRLLASREREEARAQAKKNKRKASNADLDEGHRKSSRQKTTLGGRKVGETSDAIEAYKRQREQKGKRDELRRRDAATKKSDRRSRSRDGSISDEDADGESEVEWDDRADRSPTPPKDDPPAELRDLQRVRVGRSNFAQVCFYPGFDDAISGCYARVNIGPNRETGLNEYRVCLIKKFTEGKPYAMEGNNGRTFATNQYAVLAHGKAEREFPFIACSDSPFTEAEFNRYRQTMAVEDCKMPTKSMLAVKVSDINRLINHKFTTEELNEKLRKQGTFDVKGMTFRRIELEKQLKSAMASGDEAEIAKIEAEIRELTGPKLALGSASKPQTQKQSEQQRLLELNLRNQKLNAENVRRAQIEEKKASRKMAAAVARGEAVTDRFARVKTRAKTHYDVTGNNRLVPMKDDLFEGSDRSHTGTPVPGSEASKVNTPKRSDTPSGTQKKPSKGGVVIRHRNMDDENIAALDLDIDIEI
ncbi:RNA polymerase-associated protein rtf1 [Paecilomyces lecythidis]|uniref:RNA polymerase-associated protein rtf1 n=1 Tax=Paecilomyces lecythidis TaxID=3004212 RepID=A0ABR3XU03_9EURO